MKAIALLASVILVTGVAAAVFAAQRQARAAFTDPQKAGPDFKVQGEYVGDIVPGDTAHQRLGAQVIALGNGKFRAVFLPGGLPGDGWDGKTRVQVDGQTSDGQTTFTPTEPSYQAVIKGDAMTVKSGTSDRYELRRIVRKSPTQGAAPPQGAIILFDGTDTGHLVSPKIDDRKLLAVGTSTKHAFGDFTLHAEFMTPFMPTSGEQGRGNSGIYLQQRYEVQILDSFGHPAESNGCASLYRQVAPSVNMCYPPLQWQTFDIDFQAPRFEAGKKIKNAVITLRHNGVVVHDKLEIKDKTGAGKPEGADPLPTLFQNHNDPVFFQNVWLIEK